HLAGGAELSEADRRERRRREGGRRQVDAGEEAARLVRQENRRLQGRSRQARTRARARRERQRGKACEALPRRRHPVDARAARARRRTRARHPARDVAARDLPGDVIYQVMGRRGRKGGTGRKNHPAVPPAFPAFPAYPALKRFPAKYFKPESTTTVATVLPGPISFAIFTAAAMLRPLDVPTRMPSSRASRRAIARPSASSIARASS